MRTRIPVNARTIIWGLFVIAFVSLFGVNVPQAFGADLPLAKTPAITTDIVGTTSGAAVPFDLTNHDTCTTQGLTYSVPANGAVFVEHAGDQLGCSVPVAIIHLPDTATWLARFTFRDSGVIRSSFVTGPLASATNDRAAVLEPILNAPGTFAYVTTFPREAATVTLTFSDGVKETWNVTPPFHQHQVAHQIVGKATLSIGVPGIGPWPAASIPCLLTMDDGATANTIAVPCR